MSKRVIDREDSEQERNVFAKTENGSGPTHINSNGGDVDMIVDDGQFSDDFESDEEIIELDDEEDIELDGDDEKLTEMSLEKAEQLMKRDEENSNKNGQELYLPHMSRPLGPDEVLEADPTVYEMLHNVNMPWPCLTLDIIPDNVD